MAGFGGEKNSKKQKTKCKSNTIVNEEALLKSAISSHMQGDLANAEKRYREAMKIGSRNSLLFSNLGTICKGSERSDEAIYLYKRAIELNPNYSIAHYNLGNLYKDLGSLDQALASTLKSLELKPDNPDALMNLGSIYKDLGNLDQALASILKSIELKAVNPGAVNNLKGLVEEMNLSASNAKYLQTCELLLNQRTCRTNINRKYSYSISPDHPSIELRFDNL